MKQKLTMNLPALIAFIAMIVVGLTDFGYVVFSGTGSSLSAWMVAHNFNSPVWVFCAGAIVAHLFWYMHPDISNTKGDNNAK